MSMIALSIVMAITVEGLVELGKSIGKAAYRLLSHGLAWF